MARETERFDKFAEATNLMEQVQKGKTASFWLRDALESAWQRDCIDALKDAELLTHILRLRMEYYTGVKE